MKLHLIVTYGECFLEKEKTKERVHRSKGKTQLCYLSDAKHAMSN